MSKIIRKTALFFAVVFIMQLCSCGVVVINYDKLPGGTEKQEGTEVVNGTDTAVTEPPVTLNVIENDYTDEIKANLAKIPDNNYNGNVFKITSPDASTLDGDGDYEFLSEAAAKRNNYVSEKHNISIVASSVDYNTYYAEVNTAVKSGMYYADLMMIPQEMVCSFAAGNLILNMRSMPELDFDAGYFNKSSVGAAAGGFNSYAIAGYASVYPHSLPVIFFNKDLTGEEIYSTVTSGNWTWDRFFEIALGASADEYCFSWGTADMGEAVYESAFVSCGNTMINSGIMQVPALAFDKDTSATAVDVIKRLYNADSTVRVNVNTMSYFNEGNGYFYIEKLSKVNDLRGSKINWGILPLPKADPSANYATLAGKDSLMFACPATVSTPDKSAVILMSLNAASEGIIKDAYIEYMQYNFLRDNGSANMLEYVIDGVVYDFSYTFGNRYAGIADGTYHMIRRAALPEESMESLINRYKGTLDRTLAGSFGLSN